MLSDVYFRNNYKDKKGTAIYIKKDIVGPDLNGTAGWASAHATKSCRLDPQ